MDVWITLTCSNFSRGPSMCFHEPGNPSSMGSKAGLPQDSDEGMMQVCLQTIQLLHTDRQAEASFDCAGNVIWLFSKERHAHDRHAMVGSLQGVIEVTQVIKVTKVTQVALSSRQHW